jgi:hypothetical protein
MKSSEVEAILRTAPRDRWDSPDGIVTTAPQMPSGRSAWAKWVRRRLLPGEWIVWAYINPGQATLDRQWLGVLIDSGQGKGRFFDLRYNNRELENFTAQVGNFLKGKEKEWWK